jgi:hypothetical protein
MTGWLWLMEHPVVLSAAFAGAITFGWYSSRRARARQTSFYQPVRLLKLRQNFLSGIVTGFRLGFSNDTYADQFISANQKSVSSGLVEVAKI